MFKRIAAVAALLAIGAFAQQDHNPPRRAPSFALPDWHIQYHDILDYRGKPLIIEIMSTRCPHCDALAGVLEKVNNKYGDRIAILSVVLPPDNQSTVRQFIEKNRVTHPVLFDCSQMTSSYFQATPDNPHIDVPHLFFVDAAGMIQDDFLWTQPPEGKPADAEISVVLDRLLRTK